MTMKRALVLLLLAVEAGAGQDPPAQAPSASEAPAAEAAPAPRFAIGPVFDEEWWRDLPLGHGIWSAFETAEATAIVDRMENGGLFTGEPGRLGIHGSSWTQVSYRLGDLELTDPDGLGTPLLLPELAALGRLDVASGLMPAELGGPGAVVRLVPHTPAGAWRGSLGGDFVPVGWQPSLPAGPPAIERYASFGSGRFRLDGPLLERRLGLLLAGALVRGDRNERGAATRLMGREAGLLAGLQWKASARDVGTFFGAAQGVGRPYPGRARIGEDTRENDRFLLLQATWERRTPVPWAFGAGFTRGASDPDLAGHSPVGLIERLRDGPVPAAFPGADTRQALALFARMGPRIKELARGRHAFRLGLGGSLRHASTTPAGEAGPTPETVDGLPARVWDYDWAGPESKWRAFDASFYLADTASYGRASFDVGLRFDSTSASAASGPGRIGWRSLLPRVSARFRIAERGALTFRGGYARYQHRLPLGLLAFGDPTARQGSVYRWTDANGDGAFQAAERGALIARVGPGGSVASIDPELGPPHTEEVVAGVEFRLGKAWTAHALAIHRRERDLVAALNLGAPASAHSVSYVEDPGGDILGAADDQLLPLYDRRPESFGRDQYLLTNTAENALHEGVEIAAQRRLGGRFFLRIGAMAYRSEGPGADRGFEATENDQGLIGERLADPNATTFARGRLFFDRAFTIKVAASYRAPLDVRIGVVARYQDGQPFARLVIAPLLNQGPEAVQAIPNGRSRFTYTGTLDARLEKGFNAGRVRVAGVVEAFNLLNETKEVEEVVVTGPSFREVTFIQPPRAWRLGLRLDF